MANKIIQSYNTYDNLIKSVNNYDIDKIMNIQGLSQQKALEIIKYIQEDDEKEYLKTSQAKIIYEDIIKKLLFFTNTTYAHNRILLLTPSNNYDKIQDTQKLIRKTTEDIKSLDLAYIRSLYSDIKPLKKDITPHFNDAYAIICEDYNDYIQLLGKNFDKYTNVHPIEDQVNLEQYEFIIYLYNQCEIELGDTNNIIMISNTREDYEIQPSIIIEYYKQNKKILESTMKVRQYLQQETNIPETLDALEILENNNQTIQDIEEITESIKDEANKILKQKIKQIDLNGDEVLQLLDNQNMPPKITEIFEETLTIAKDEIQEKTGLNYDPFIIKYPLEIDYQELKRIKENEIANKHLKEFEQELDACSILIKYKKQIEQEIQDTIHYDYPLTLATFTEYYQLTLPEIGKEFKLKNALHLTLKQEEIETNKSMQKINYQLDNENNIVLLTGANSGGKTTLLETLAQHTIMAHMGLGTTSEQSTIPEIKEVYYFTKKHSLNAGAFETFLKTFIPVTIGETKKLILIDELESITELEAAIKIIIGFIEHITNKNTYAVIVTHMAPEILKHINTINIRTDGIEAKGLDEKYNLIVDRSPKINYLAKSTPELILKKIYNQTDEPLKDIYKDILNKF